jgi:long-chain acyl-CoA synthetase
MSNDTITRSGSTVERLRPPSATESKTLGSMILAAANRPGTALRYKEHGQWREVSYVDLVRDAKAIAKGLVALGIEPGERVSILSDTRPEWTVADLGSFCAGTVVAPIYHTNSPEECEYVLRHSEARAVFCEDASQLAKIAQIKNRCPELRHVIAFEDAQPDTLTMEDLKGIGYAITDEEVITRATRVNPHDTASLVYTSGTTGPPKACMLTHRNFIAQCRLLEERLQLERRGAPIEFFQFLPLAHVFARIVQVFAFELGATLIFWSRDSTRLLDDIKEARPTYFASVPRVWEKIHAAATSGIAEQPWPKRALFTWAIDVGRRMSELTRAGKTPGRALRLQHRLADRLVHQKVRALFGGRLELTITAAAPIPRDVLEFFDACGIVLLEVWGMTELCGAGTVNAESERKLGSVGRPLSDLEMGVAEDGELHARGPIVFAGYFKDEAATRETLPGGWLATGDLGEIDADGFVTITGRKKDLIITSSGKNITPANIENALKETRWISEAVVYGDGRPYLVALLTLDAEEAPKLAAQLGVPADVTTMCRDERVRAEMQKAVDAVNSRFARIEQVKSFAILDRELTQEQQELTPTLKVKRGFVYREFSDTFNDLYEG